MNTPLSALIQTIGLIVAASLLFATVFLSFPKVDTYLNIRSAEARTAAINQCANASRYTYTDTTDGMERITEEPSQKFYLECLKLANIQ